MTTSDGIAINENNGNNNINNDDADPWATETSWDIARDALIATRDAVLAIIIAIFRLFISPSRKSVRDEIVFITGSGSGIGRELSLEFAKLGAIVVLCDINYEGNAETARLVQELGAKAYLYTCDVSDREAVYRTAADVRHDVGDVSILVNNAGIVNGKSLLCCPDDKIEKIFDINLLAHFWTIKAFLPQMIRNNHGHIVSVSSAAGLVGLNKLVDYSATKFGVVGLIEVLGYELAFSGCDGVMTTVLCPSFVQTGMFEGCRMRFPWLLPDLTTEYAVHQMMQGILTNQAQVCIPRAVYTFSFVKTLFPVEASLAVHKFFGANKFMDSFIGRTKQK